LLEVKKMKTKKKREEKLVEEEEGECSTDTEDESFNYYKRKKPAKESSNIQKLFWKSILIFGCSQEFSPFHTKYPLQMKSIRA
jgi:hypothetical protein